MDCMLDDILVPNTLRLTSEFTGGLKFALESPANRALVTVKVVAAETGTIPGRCAHAVTMRSRMTLCVDYVFTS